MTVVYRCDGPACDTTMGEDEPRIAIELVNEPELRVEASVEPEELLVAIGSFSFGFTGTHHFHSAECLAAWAMSKHLDAE